METLLIIAIISICFYQINKEAGSDAAVCRKCKENGIKSQENCKSCKEFNY